MSDIHNCNVTINNEQYYTNLPDQGLRAVGNLATIAWDYTMFTTCCYCFFCMLIIALVVYASSGSPIPILLASICCCASSTYYYFGYNNAKNDLENLTKDVTNNKTSRPCKDPITNKVYN